MICGGGGGTTSTTWPRCRRAGAAPDSDPSHPQHRSGSITTVSSGSSTRLRDAKDAPGCLPGLRPDRVRDDRFLAGFLSHGASEEGGRDEFDESADRRRSSSAIRSDSSASIRFSSAFSARNAAFSAASCCSSNGASGTTTPCPTPPKDQHDTPTAVIPTHPPQPQPHPAE